MSLYHYFEQSLMMHYRHYGYIPFSVLEPSSVGRQTREGSRTLEYAFEDFAIHQVAQLLGNSEDEATYYNRSLVRNSLSLPITDRNSHFWDGYEVVSKCLGSISYQRRL